MLVLTLHLQGVAILFDFLECRRGSASKPRGDKHSRRTVWVEKLTFTTRVDLNERMEAGGIDYAYFPLGSHALGDPGHG